jgi:hypothetical protein
MYGKKNYTHQSIHGSNFFVMIKTMTLFFGHIHSSWELIPFNVMPIIVAQKHLHNE